MKKTDAEAFAKKLIKRGYRKWIQAKYGSEDYDVSLAIRNEEDTILYQIIYRFWDWTEYQLPKDQEEFSIDLVIMPCLHTYGRADLILSNAESKNYLDVKWTEKFAKEYYEFITERI
jgi:hypothetical protein